MRIPFLRSKRKQNGPQEKWPMSRPLFQWSPQDNFTIADSVKGLLATGETGSGKTTTTAKMAALAFLKAGYGGVVLVTKPDECAMWQKYCAMTGRTQDLRILGPDNQPWKYNFLADEQTRGGGGGGHTENVLNLLTNVLEVSNRSAGGSGGREDGDFWRQYNRALLRNAIDLSAMATGSVSIGQLHKIVLSAPTSLDQLRSEAWQKQSYCFQCLRQADDRSKSDRQEHDFGIVADFFADQWPNLADRTRSVVVATCESTIDVLNRGRLFELFCTQTTITPRDVEAGAIIVLDMPVKEWGELGVIGQTIFKLSFQRSIERRDTNANPRPVFLFADEFQNFATSYDAIFQTTCRSSRVATVYLTQNIAAVHAALGGSEKGKSEAAALVANLSVKVFHANACGVTNEMASTMIGRSRQFLMGSSSSSANNGLPIALGIEALGQPASISASVNEVWEHEVQQAAFTQLKTGGPDNDCMVEAIVFQNGRRFAATGKTWLPVSFKQQF